MKFRLSYAAVLGFSIAAAALAQEEGEPVEPADGAAAKPAAKAPMVSEAEAKAADELFEDGRKLYFQGKFAESIDKFKQAAEANPAKTSYKLLLAKAYREVGQNDDAAEVFEAVIKDSPDHVEAAIELAELLSPQKSPDRVIALLTPLLSRNHDYPLYRMLAAAHYQKESFPKAREYYEEAVRLNPRNRDDFYQLGNIYLAQKRFAKAGEAYETAGRLGYTSGVFHFKLASVYFNLRNYLGKVTTAEVAGGEPGTINNGLLLIEAVPGKPTTFYVAGPKSAAFQAAKARAEGIDVFDIRFLQANIYLAARHFAQAEAAYAELAEKVSKADAGLFWSQWAQASLGSGDYDKYLERLAKAIEAEPKVYKATMSDALVTVARRYQEQGDDAKYLEFLNRAVVENPLSARLHLMLGDSYWSSGEKPKAIQQYKLVLELEPEFPQRVRLLNRIRGQDDAALTTAKGSTVPTPPGLAKITATCLLSGEAANPEFSLTYHGGKLHFCCESCQQAFTADPAKYAAKANHHLYATGQAQAVSCAFTGRKLKPEIKVSVGGVELPLCCQGCKKTAEEVADGDARIELIFSGEQFNKYFRVVGSGE